MVNILVNLLFNLSFEPFWFCQLQRLLFLGMLFVSRSEIGFIFVSAQGVGIVFSKKLFGFLFSSDIGLLYWSRS
jgi:hypothetical protein